MVVIIVNMEVVVAVTEVLEVVEDLTANGMEEKAAMVQAVHHPGVDQQWVDQVLAVDWVHIDTLPAGMKVIIEIITTTIRLLLCMVVAATVLAVDLLGPLILVP